MKYNDVPEGELLDRKAPRCWFGHVWSFWTNFRLGVSHRSQFRVCLRCNYAQVNEVRE